MGQCGCMYIDPVCRMYNTTFVGQRKMAIKSYLCSNILFLNNNMFYVVSVHRKQITVKMCH